MELLTAIAEFGQRFGPWAAIAVLVYVVRLLDGRVGERDATIAKLQDGRVDDEKSRTGFMVAVSKEQTSMLSALTRRGS